MKKSILSAVIATSLLATSAFAAGETARPPQGQPPMGQPGMGQPNQPGQPPQGQPPMGQPGMGQPNQSGQPSQGQPGMGQPQMGDKAMDPAKVEAMCRKIEPKVRKAAEACLKRKDGAKRGQCFEAIGQKFFQGRARACEGFFQPMKAEYEAKERELYPNQPSAMGGGERREGQDQKGQPNQSAQPQQGQTSQPQMGTQAPVDCGKVVAEAKKLGAACLAKGKTDQRRACWEQAGDKLHKLTGGNPACESALEGVRQEMMGAEGQKYPKQEKAFH